MCIKGSDEERSSLTKQKQTRALANYYLYINIYIYVEYIQNNKKNDAVYIIAYLTTGSLELVIQKFCILFSPQRYSLYTCFSFIFLDIFQKKKKRRRQEQEDTTNVRDNESIKRSPRAHFCCRSLQSFQ